jgi:hypothetical protein
MDESRFDDIVKLLVSGNVMIDPTLVYGAKGVMPRWNEYELECRHVLDDPNLAYIPRDVSDSWCSTRHLTGATPEDLKRRRTGYDKMTRFLKRFADAGGVIVAGSDFVGSAIPGLTLHNEMATYVHDIGLTPMQAIQTATRNTAEFYLKGKGLGTITQGSLADILIVRGNPLQRIEDSRNVEVVIKDGRVLERGYHLTYANPYKRPFPARDVPDVVIASIKPYVVAQDDTNVTITLKGTGFRPGSIVWLSETPLKTTFVSATELTASLCDRCTEAVGPMDVRVSQSFAGPRTTAATQLLVTHRLTKGS